MRKKMQAMSLAVALALGGSALAQVPPAPGQRNPVQAQQNEVGGQQEAQAKQLERIATFVGEDAVVVAKVDLARFDPQATRDWVKGFLEAAIPNAQQRQNQIDQLQKQTQASQEWVGKMRQAGGETLYAVVSRRALAGQGPQPGAGQDQEGPQEVLTTAILVPVDPGDNAQQMQDLLLPQEQAQGQPKEQQVVTSVIRDTVVLAPQAMIERFQQRAQSDAESLGQAMNAVSGATVQLAFAPTERMRETAKSMADQAGQNLPQGVTAEDIKAIPEGLQWASIGLDTPPNQSMTVIIQATNPQAAQQMSETITKLLNSAKQNPQVAERMPNIDQFVQTLTPKVVGDRLRLSLNQQEMDRLFKENIATAIRNAQGGEPVRAGEIPGGEEDHQEPEQPEMPQQQPQR